MKLTSKKITLGQIKPVTGDIEGNTQQILDAIIVAKKEKSTLIVFPETAITGYCCGALFEQEEFIKQNLEALQTIISASKDIAVIVGYVDLKGTNVDGSLQLTNSAALIENQKMVGTYDKILLANDGHHEDRKYFIPGKNVKVFTLAGMKIGTLICEDMWNENHSRDLVAEAKENGAELIVCINYSYFYTRKQETRHALVREHAREKNVNIIFVNAVGVGDILKDILIYDGSSIVYTGRGELLVQAKRFEKDILSFDLNQQKIQEPEYEKYEELFDALVFEQRELFRVQGIKNAQVHMSGGLDSSVIGALVAKAMGPLHTVFITNPTIHNSDKTKNNAYWSAKQLGVTIYTNETQLPYVAAMKSFEKGFGEAPTLQQQTPLEAVMRTAQGISATHYFKSGIVATPNHTEIVLGWTTFHDIGSIGVHAPIGDLTKLELYEFARYINQRMGLVIPENLCDGTVKPSAELADANEDPIDYTLMSGICAEIIRKRRDPKTIISLFEKRKLTEEYFLEGIYETDLKYFEEQVWTAFRLSKLSVFKAAQSAPIVLVNKRGRGFSNRETIINKWSG